jgi:adenylate cyclase
MNDADTRLPERVLAAIREQQNASEVLIGWFQLGVVGLFGTLYALAPKTFADDATIKPVPWALGLYLAFTLIRLALAHRHALSRWILYLSVVVDMTLLVALIWSFHVQYMQPAAFYLKAPTLLYVFIFIALRALRFEARFVVLAGICAALGWTVLVLIAVAGTQGTAPITRDYVVYMTSSRVLIGAEVDKIISILTVTAIIAVAIRRARSLLVRAVAESQAAAQLSRFFAPDVARTITGAERAARAGEGVACEATILFTDIRGFSELADRVPPDVLMKALADYQARMVPLIQARGGAIDKFMGDGIMASFGAARDSDTFAADAIAAIDAVMDEADAWNAARVEAGEPPLRVGAAAATGRIVFGAVGAADRLEYTVIGSAVNRAAKLEKHTKAEKVRALADMATWRRAQDQGYVAPAERERRPGRAVEGLAEPIDVMVLAG